MEITTFCPLIVSPNADEVVALFEELGFERKHTKKGLEGEFCAYEMRLGDAFRVSVVQADVPRDQVSIRMNVRNFGEAYELLESKGFKNIQGDKVTDTGSSMATNMIAPSGFAISLSEHLR